MTKDISSWVLGLIAAILLAIFGWVFSLSIDRVEYLERRNEAAWSAIISNSNRISVIETRWGDLDRRLDRIETKLDRALGE